jgi:hypothetical protein
VKIHLSYVAARNRATGEIEMLTHIESLLGGADVSPIAEAAAPGTEAAVYGTNGSRQPGERRGSRCLSGEPF